MKITQVQALPVSIPYLNPYSDATGTAPTGDHVIVKLHTDEGIIGLGEATHIQVDRTGESQESITLIIRHRLGPMLIGEDPFDIDRIMSKLEGATMGKYGFLFSKAAIDCALWDIMGKALQVPVYKLLGGANRKKIRLARSLPIKPPAQMGQDALALKEKGYKLITIKAGMNPKEDIERVAAVRDAVGPTFPIEVDANQGYTADVAVRTLRKMERYDIASCEQPCPWWDLDGMAEVTRAIDTPIVADESVLTPVDVLNVAKKRAADVICLKLPKSGGVYLSKRMVAIAEAAGLRCTIGSKHPFGVGTAILDHFVAATNEVEDPIGYGSALERFGDDIITEPIQVEDGYITVLEKPGLGVELDEEKMAKYARPIVGG
jgi:L-alanine-DL-glutamate epimerase-like enolase superfamily enzyme